MTGKLRSWIIAGIIVLVIVIGLIVVWRFNGTGFGEYDKVTKEHTPAGQLTKTTTESQPGKTVWDWLGLLAALAIPVVVGLGATWFTTQQAKVSDTKNTDNQRETALQAYIDKISELLLTHQLRESKEDEEIRKIARVRTITILFQLDARRIGYVFAFLREAGLMSNKPNSSIVSLSQADLRKINWSQADIREASLSGANLNGAKLSGAYLIEADLSRAYLNRASLSGADLSEANLSEANLEGADLTRATVTQEQLAKATSLQGATMRDGSKHS